MKPCTSLSVLAVLAVSALAVIGQAAHAHVTLEQGRAAAGAAYKAVLRVGHGCEGEATHTLRVRIPAGFRGVKPMPKAGWSISLERTQGDVSSITWTANSREAWLPDGFYDEFVLRGQTPSQPGPLWFSVLQQCEKSSNDWSEVPPQGHSTAGLRTPAALLLVEPSTHAGQTH
jgi:periplasmic copper chaperone A